MDFPSDCRYTEDHEWVRLSDDGTTGTVGITDFDALPAAARDYLARIEQLAGVPIDIISTGPDREQTIIKQHPFG